MNASRFTIPLISIAIALAVFCVSWFTFNTGLFQKLFPDAAEGFVTPANESIEAWNAFASENAISIIVQTPISLSQAPVEAEQTPTPQEG